MSRAISNDVTVWLNGLLVNDPLAKSALEHGDARRLMTQLAIACLGIEETPVNKGVEVERFQKTVELDTGAPWCMCFVQTCLAYAEKATALRSPVKASGSCVQVWEKTPLTQRVKSIPLAGAIAIWRHTSDPVHGHTGIVLDCDGTSFHAIEGNVSEGYADLYGQVGRGQGVRYTHRRFDLFNPERDDMQLLGFIRPF